MNENDELSDMEAELGNETPLETNDVSTGSEPTQPVTPANEYVVGNRKYKDEADFKKSHLSMEKEYSRLQNELKQFEPVRKWHQAITQHPELLSELNKRSAEYFKRLESGQSKTTAQKGAGIPDEVARELGDVRNFMEEVKLNKERDQLMQEHPELTKEDLQEIYKVAMEEEEAGRRTPLSKVYWLAIGPKLASRSQLTAEQKVAESQKAKRLANVGPSNVTGLTPTAKDSTKMSQTEHDQAILKVLFPEKYGS